MESVSTTIEFPEQGFTFKVRAFRKLTDAEMQLFFKEWCDERKGRPLPRNKTVTLICFWGKDGT